MTNKSIIFLDFDGVLNTGQYQAQLAMEGKPTRDAWGPLFDPRAVENLKLILDASDADVVVTSSWRYILPARSLRMMWKERNMPGRIGAILPCDTFCLSRGEEIECWLSDHGRPRYIILDDVDEFSPGQHDRLVEVNPVVGISEADAERGIGLLTP